jgi:predicted N-acyltransferase
MVSGTATSIEIVRTLDDVDPVEWERLASGKSIYATWAWYRSLERHEHFQPRYLVARGRDGSLRGALPAYLATAGGNARYDPASVFTGLFEDKLAVSESWFPGLAGGSRAGYLTHVLAAPSEDRRRTVLSLLEAFGDLAEAEAARAAWILYVPPEDAQELAEASPGDTLVLYAEADLTLPVEWPSFEGYLLSRSSRRRRAIRRELETFGGSGASVVVARLDEVASEISPLFASTQTRYGRPTSVQWSERFLREQAAALAPFSRVFLGLRDGRPIGFSLYYAFERTLYARLVGFDYEQTGQCEYFEILFYEPLRYATANGFAALHLGIESYEAKLGRGARPRPLWCLVRHREADLSSLREPARRWNASRIAAFRDRYGRLLGDHVLEEWPDVSAPPVAARRGSRIPHG